MGSDKAKEKLVFAVADQLVAKGHVPTAALVKAVLKDVDYPSIHLYLKLWQAVNPSDASQDSRLSDLEFLKTIPADTLFRVIRKESLQMIVAFISLLDSEVRGQVLSHFSPSEQEEIVLRLSQLGEINPVMLEVFLSSIRKSLE